MRLWISLWCLLVLCCSCGSDHGLMPASGGRPYEVLVVGDDPDAVEVVARELRGRQMEGLPQQEPMFDVSVSVSDGLSQATRYARNIVQVSADVDSLRRPTISCERNVYARPQLVLHLRASSVGQLRAYILYMVRAIEDQVVMQELNNGIASLRERHDDRAEKQVKSMFGARLWVPQDLTQWKCGRDFLWLSNNAAQGMQNICVYRYQGTHNTKAEAVEKRDSVMRANVHGEWEGTYMTTVESSVRLHGWSSFHSDGRVEMRGLWEMHGDAMGGGFVSHSVAKGDSTLVVEAFVYAPEMKKRNLMRRLEACLHTLKLDN